MVNVIHDNFRRIIEDRQLSPIPSTPPLQTPSLICAAAPSLRRRPDRARCCPSPSLAACHQVAMSHSSGASFLGVAPSGGDPKGKGKAPSAGPSGAGLGGKGPGAGGGGPASGWTPSHRHSLQRHGRSRARAMGRVPQRRGVECRQARLAHPTNPHRHAQRLWSGSVLLRLRHPRRRLPRRPAVWRRRHG